MLLEQTLFSSFLLDFSTNWLVFFTFLGIIKEGKKYIDKHVDLNLYNNAQENIIQTAVKLSPFDKIKTFMIRQPPLISQLNINWSFKLKKITV